MHEEIYSMLDYIYCKNVYFELLLTSVHEIQSHRAYESNLFTIRISECVFLTCHVRGQVCIVEIQARRAGACCKYAMLVLKNVQVLLITLTDVLDHVNLLTQ